MASLFDLSLEFYALKDLIDNDLEVNEETGEITDNTEILNKLFNMISSVSVSTADKQSSKIRISGSLISALAMETRCFCPPDKVTPRSPT